MKLFLLGVLISCSMMAASSSSGAATTAQAQIPAVGTTEANGTSLDTVEADDQGAYADEDTGLAAGTTCRVVSRCALWSGSLGTYYNGRFLYCGC